DPAKPVVWKTNFPGEVFYQSVQAFLPVFGVAKGLGVDMAMEATFLSSTAGGTAFDSANPIAFTRIRFTQLANKQGAPPVNFVGTYRITYPYGTFTFSTSTAGSLFGGKRTFTLDVPPGVVGVYNAAVGPPQGGAVPAANIIGTFLSSVTAAPGFIGDGVTPTAIVGSPTGNDFFRIERTAGGVPGDSGDLGPNCPTLPASQSCIETASFTVTGKKASGGPATHLAVTGLTAGTTGTPQTAVVKALDANDLPDFGFAGTVALTANDPNAVLSPPSTTLVNGAASVTVTPKAAGSFTVTATDQTAATTVAPGSQTVALAPRLQVVSGDLQTGGAGEGLPLPLVVRALDANTPAAPVPGVLVTFAASTGASVTPASGFTDATGLAQTTATLGKTPGSYTATASAAGSGPVTFTASAVPGAPASLSLGLPAAATAGQAAGVSVAAFDAFGNPTTFSGALTFTSSDPTFVPPVAPALALGTVSSVVTFHAAGSQTLTVALTDAPAVRTSQAVVVAAAPASSMASVPGSGGQSAPGGTQLPLPLAVKVVDAFGNAVAGTTVTFTAPSGGSVSPASVATGVDGVASAFATLPSTAGTCTFTATAAGLTPVSLSELALPGAVSRIQIFGLGPSVTAGSPVSLSVQAFDSQNNQAPGNVPVFFTSNDSAATLPASALLNNGQGQFSVTFKTATATQTALTVTAPGATPIVASVATTVLPAAPAVLKLVSAPGAMVVRAPATSPFVVQVVDAFGNAVKDVTVSFAAASGGSISPATVLSDAAGKAQAIPSAPNVAATYGFTATAPGLPAPQVSILVSAVAGDPHHLVMSPPPATPLDDCGCYDVDVKLVDALGNVVPTPLPGVTASATGKALLSSVDLAPGSAPAPTIQGALGPGGTAVLHVCDATPESSTVQVSAATLPSASQVLRWRLGPTDAQASVVSADTPTLVAWSGKANIKVDPRSACGNRTGAGQAVVARLIGPGTLAAVTDVGDGTYTAPLTVSPCPAAATTEVAVRVGAIDLPLLTEALRCVVPALDRTGVAFSRTVVPMCDAAAKDQVAVRVTPRDAAGTPLGAGNAVSLAVEGLVGDGAMVDVGDGSYTTTFTVASCSATARTPTVKVNGVDLARADLALHFTCPSIDVAASGVAFSAQDAPADGVRSVEVTVAAVNACGEPARGRAVRLAVDLGVLASSEGTTDAAGAWMTTVSSKQAGTATATASVDGVVLPRATATFVAPAAPPQKGGCATGGSGGAAALAGLVTAALAARRRGRRSSEH
ncbi:MAG: Ig-like domain-containing protein, partial [Anaeromyxobacteraceae bacterium]